MRVNVLWFATKQLRFSQWLYEKLFNLGTDLHALKKYHKVDPSVAEIVAKQHGGKIYPALVEKLVFHGHEVPDHLREKPKRVFVSAPLDWKQIETELEELKKGEK